MSEDFDALLRRAMVEVYDAPWQVPGLTASVAAMHTRRRARRRVVVPGTVALIVAGLVALPLLLRSAAHQGTPSVPGATSGSTAPSAADSVTPSTAAATSPAPPAAFAELRGWWRFTSLQAPGGSVPILRGMPAYLHFDSETQAAAEIGNNTTSLGTTYADGRLGLVELETSAVSSAPGENAVDSYLDHLTGGARALVSGDALVLTGPDGSQAQLARIEAPANAASWTCCEPTSEAPVASPPATLPACEAANLTASVFAGYRSEYDDYHEVLVRTTGPACLLSGPVTASYAAVGAPVKPLHPDRQQSPFPAAAVSPTVLTSAQDANQAWTSALTVAVYSQSTGELTPQDPCAAADVVTVTTVTLKFAGGNLTVPVPGGLVTCSGNVGLGQVQVR